MGCTLPNTEAHILIATSTPSLNELIQFCVAPSDYPTILMTRTAVLGHCVNKLFMRPVRRSTAHATEASSFMLFVPACTRTTLGPRRRNRSAKLDISEIVASYAAFSVVVVHVDRIYRSDLGHLVLIEFGDKSVENGPAVCALRHIGINKLQNRPAVGRGEPGDSETSAHISCLRPP